LTYVVSVWENDELEALHEAAQDAIIWAERYNDDIMLHQLKLLLNLITARFGPVKIEV